MSLLSLLNWKIGSRKSCLRQTSALLGLQAESLLHKCRANLDCWITSNVSTSREGSGYHSSAVLSNPPGNRGAQSGPTSAAALRQQRQPSTGGVTATPAPAPSNLGNTRIGTIHVQSTNNNTICTLVDEKGNPQAWCSAGSVGFKNARKSTTYAAQATAETIAARSLAKGFFLVRVVMKGVGYGKQSAMRALFKSGLRVSEIHEVTPLPYNGCRAPKKRRV